MSKKASPIRFRNLVRQIHLVLGLLSGLVVFIVAVTGCCWVFQDEIKGLVSQPPLVEGVEKTMLLPGQARKIAEAVLPARHIHGILYGGRNEAVEVIFYEADPEFYQAVFLHPYSGEVLRVENYLSGFFPFVLEGHLYLWLPEEVGKQVVSWSTLIFVIMLISGIVLWWPKNKKGRKQRFTFDWKSGPNWKRKNYDLHAVGGFYASFIALVIAYTGLVMAFDWLEQSAYQLVGGEKSVAFTIPNNSTEPDSPPANLSTAMDRLMPRLMEEYAHARTLEFHYPPTDSSSIYVEIAYEEGVYYSSDYRFYDQHSLAEVETPSLYDAYENASFSDKVIRMNYDVHVGAIGGLPGKILAFLASLTVASLPVTGFMVWLGRKKKKKTTRESFERDKSSALKAGL